MRLAVCSEHFPTVSETFVTSEVADLTRLGHDVTVVARDVNRDLLDRRLGRDRAPDVVGLDGFSDGGPARLGDRVRRAAGAAAGMPGFAVATRRPLRYLRHGIRHTGLLACRAYHRAGSLGAFDLVQAHMAHCALWARAIALRRGIPLAVTVHGYDVTVFPSEFGWPAYHPLLDRPRATFIAHSPFTAALLRENLGVSPLMVPLGVHTELFTPRRAAPGRDDASGPRLLFVGRLIPKKGLRLAIEALALLVQAGAGPQAGATLDIVGDGPEGGDALHLAEALGVRSRVRMHGALDPDGVAETMARSDFLVAPSLRDIDGAEEAFGLVCLEAQASGLLVVGTHCGGMPHAVAPPVGGRCVAQHDPLAIAAAIVEMWTSADLPRRRAAARGRVVAVHDAPVALATYVSALEHALRAGCDGRPRPDASGEWNVPPDSVDTPPAARGSLPAYTRNRQVMEIRPADADPLPREGQPLGWSVVAPGGQARLPADGPPRILLDLHGGAPRDVLRTARSLDHFLRPGDRALWGVRCGEPEARKVRDDLAAAGGGALLLDRLFVPDAASGHRSRYILRFR